MAEGGVSLGRADSVRFVFDEIERMALDIRTISADSESRGERNTKRRRT